MQITLGLQHERTFHRRFDNLCHRFPPASLRRSVDIPCFWCQNDLYLNACFAYNCDSWGLLPESWNNKRITESKHTSSKEMVFHQQDLQLLMEEDRRKLHVLSHLKKMKPHYSSLLLVWSYVIADRDQSKLQYVLIGRGRGKIALTPNYRTSHVCVHVPICVTAHFLPLHLCISCSGGYQWQKQPVPKVFLLCEPDRKALNVRSMFE